MWLTLKAQEGVLININSSDDIGYPNKIIIKGNQYKQTNGYISCVKNRVSLVSLNKNLLNLTDISIDSYNKRALRVGRSICPGLRYTFKSFQDITVPISLDYYPSGGKENINIAKITPENICTTFEMPFFEGTVSLYADGNIDIIRDINSYKLQIELGEQPTEYEPQNLVQTTIDLNGKRLYSLGDDYGQYDSMIIENRNDGSGHADVVVEKRCKEKTIFGIENWQKIPETDDSGRNIYTAHLGDVLFTNNIFHTIEGTKEDGGIYKFYVEFKRGDDGYADIYVHTTISDVSRFKNELQREPITVIHLSQNSETEKIGEINLPFINKGITNMYIDTNNNISETSFDKLMTNMRVEYEQKTGEDTMAEKKFLDLAGLGKYDEKIKAKIAADDAKVLTDAKEYSDGLATNYDPAGSATTAKTEAVKEAKEYTDGKDVAVRAYIGTIPEEAQVASVVAYVDKKTEGIATDTAMKELEGRVTTAEGEIDAIQADYLKKADKTELQGSIDGVNGKVTTLVGADTGKSVRAIANEELAAQLIPETAGESLNTLKEIADWIQKHPEDASAMNQKITTLEGKAHEHVNKDVLDGVTAEKVGKWDDAATKAHTHENADVLAGITSVKVAAWDAAKADAVKEANSYTDGKIAEFVAITTEEVENLFK